MNNFITKTLLGFILMFLALLSYGQDPNFDKLEYGSISDTAVMVIGEYNTSNYQRYRTHLTKKITVQDFKNNFSLWKTAYGNVSLDSMAMFHQLSVYPDSVVNEGILLNAGRFHNNSSISVGTEQTFSDLFNNRRNKSLHYLRDDGLLHLSSVSDHAMSIETFKYSDEATTGNDVIMQLGGRWEYDTTDTDFATSTGVEASLHFAKKNDKAAIFFGNDLGTFFTYDDVESNSFVAMHEDSTIVNNTIHANEGIKLVELSYVPSSSTNLQAEAASAAIGTKWLLNDSGSWYEVVKISATELARTPYATW